MAHLFLSPPQAKPISEAIGGGYIFPLPMATKIFATLLLHCEDILAPVRTVQCFDYEHCYCHRDLLATTFAVHPSRSASHNISSVLCSKRVYKRN